MSRVRISFPAPKQKEQVKKTCSFFVLERFLERVRGNLLPSFSHRRLPSNSVCIVFLTNTLLYSRLVLAKNTMQDFPTTRTQFPVTEFERKRKCCRSVYGHKIEHRIYKRKRQNPSFSITKTKVETRQLVATVRITKMPTASHLYNHFSVVRRL